MTPASYKQVREACRGQSYRKAMAQLAEAGLYVSHSTCRNIVTQMMEAGERTVSFRSPSSKIVPGAPLATTDDPRGLEVACRLLLRRHLKAGQHCISDPARMTSALREAGMVPA